MEESEKPVKVQGTRFKRRHKVQGTRYKPRLKGQGSRKGPRDKAQERSKNQGSGKTQIQICKFTAEQSD
jgi:hypothetical protein